MDDSKQRKIFLIIGSILVLAIVFGSGAIFGYSQRPEVEKITSVFNKEREKPPEIDFEPFWRAWRIVEEKYAGTDDINRQKMVWGAIQGALASLGDPYTTFFPPEEKKLFESEIKGSFGGVGMEIGLRKGILTVISPIKGTPAFRTGIKPGDKILKIDEKETLDISTDEAVRLIRGEPGTNVSLLILSEASDAPREVLVTREIIQIPVIDTEVKDNVFIIQLYNFSERTPQEFQSAMKKFSTSGTDRIILDLRNNPGGFLEVAVDVSSWFLEPGQIVAREKFKNGDETLYRSRGYKTINNLPLVVLVNNGSASASEIVAGALRDHKVATMVGQKTFGKGSVQELIDLTGDTSLKITIARWLTPNGDSISESGLIPEVEIKNTEDDESKGIDRELEKAIETVKNIR